MSDKSNRDEALDALQAIYADAHGTKNADQILRSVLTAATAYALLDIADAIREHTATTRPAGKDHS